MNEQSFNKLRQIVKNHNPELTDDQINALTKKFSELAEALISLWLEQHPNATKTGQETEKNFQPRDAPQ